MAASATTELVRVKAPHFTAGLVLRDGKCVLAAPILAWCIGKYRLVLRLDFARLGYEARIVKERRRAAV